MGKDKKDFEKKKNKLGKEKKGVTATDLRFRTRAIFMPEQSVKQEHGEFVTHRNMSLADLLPQVKHHNDNVRKDALLQMKDLLSKYPHLLDFHMADICERVVECIVDLEHSVRQALHTFLQALLPAVTQDFIAPFFPLFIVYMTSALTHLKQSIRVDALSFINLWIKHFPDLVASEHPKFLRHYVTVLSHKEPTAISSLRVNSSGTASLEITGEKTRRLKDKYAQKVEKMLKKKAGGPTHNQVRVQILDSLCQLLRCTFAQLDQQRDSKIDGGMADALMEDHEDLDGEQADLNVEVNLREYVWSDESRNEIDLTLFPTLETNSITLQSVFEGTEVKRSIMMRAIVGGATSAPGDTDFRLDIDPRAEGGLMEYVSRIFPLLINSWIECDPGVVTSHSQIKSLCVISDTLHLIFSRFCDKIPTMKTDLDELNGTLRPMIMEVAKHLHPHFPIETPAGWSEAERHDVDVLNASLSTFFCNFIVFNSSNTQNSKEDNAASSAVTELLDSVVNYFSRFFRVPKSKKSDAMEVDSGSASVFSKPEFVLMVSLFPTLQRLIRNTSYVSTQQRQKIITAFNKCFAECSPKSATKRACVFFIRDLLLSEQATVNLLPSDTVKSWLENLPKILWQLQDSNPVASLVILRLLKFYSQRYSTGSSVSSSLAGLQKALVPFFYTEITTEKRGQQVRRELFGPFIKLPDDVQRAAIELLFYFEGGMAANMISALVKCACHCTQSAPAQVDPDAMDTDDTHKNVPTLTYSTSLSTLRFLIETLQSEQHFPSAAEYIGFHVSLVLSTSKPQASSTPLSAIDFQTVRHRIRKVAALCAFRCSALGLGKDLLDSVSQILQPILEKATSPLVQAGALNLLSKIVANSGPKVHSLPDSLDRDNMLPHGILRYLQACFDQNVHDIDVKTAKDLFLAYPTRTLGAILNALSSNQPSSVFTKAFLEHVIITEQQTLLAALVAVKDDVKKAVDSLASSGPSLLVERLLSELQLLVTGT